MEENTDCRARRAPGSDVRREAEIVRSRDAPGSGALFPRRAAAARAATSSTDVRPQTPQAEPITVARRARRRSARGASVTTRTFFASSGATRVSAGGSMATISPISSMTPSP